VALANFFDKAALAASQILQGYSKVDFEKRLDAVTIEVAFDGNAISCPEGLFTLDLTTRLLSRLYPNLYFTPLDEVSGGYTEKLNELAKSINPVINLKADSPFATIMVGSTAISRKDLLFYIGSDEWSVLFSKTKPVGSGNSGNPFGAGAAACFGAANVFRSVFKDQLVNGETDNEFSVSLYNFQKQGAVEKISIAESPIKFNEVFLVGLGAIGNGALWALSKLNITEGNIYIIDPEKIELSNLQRYVLATQDDVDSDKIKLCDRYAYSTFKPYKGSWSDFLNVRKDWNLPLVALALDSAADRIAVQSSLPQIILNAWTQPSDLGISRHYDFLEQPCVACLYPPKTGLQSKSQLIAGAVGLPEKEVQIRELIYNNSPLDETWIKEIAEANKVAFVELKQYIGMPVSVFYSKVLCGGRLITSGQNRQMETPMAFQSALAGILLASELVLYTTGKRKEKIETMTRIDLLRPLVEYLNEPLLKTANEYCICNDPDFRKQYEIKYS
jgi:hypothetical protein